MSLLGLFLQCSRYTRVAMKQSTAFLTTLREPPSDAEVTSHRLLAQAGLIDKVTSGIYSYTPAMWRTLKKISDIVREEMDRAGAQELMLPILQPTKIWDQSGRLDRYVADGILFHFRDRKDAHVCLGPTHEEVVTLLANRFVSSYKQLPVNLYQIQTKFRDEIRPRFGLMRGREFIMKDAYSFDVDEEGLQASYDAMSDAYRKAFSRCGLDFLIVDADAGAIGGSGSQEFIVTAETGEDLFLICREAGYAANQERAVSVVPPQKSAGSDPLPLEKVHTPQVGTIEELRQFFPDYGADQFLKTILYRAVYKDREETVAALLRGDQEVNEVKLNNQVDALTLRLATDDEVREATGAEVGFAGPVGLTSPVRVVADISVRGMCNFVVGANETDYHLKNVNLSRDFEVSEFTDIRLAREGEECVDSEGLLLTAARGIEVGHIFKLGTKYSEPLGACFTDEKGAQRPFVMGCYGIGVSRIAAAAVEQSHDEKGIIWPQEIAPWTVHLLCLNPKKEAQAALGERAYALLQEAGLDVLYDDRRVSTGVKFNDADLLGLPLRLIVGRDAAEGRVEFAERRAPRDREVLSLEDAVDRIRHYHT